jgi:hypothetical protein
MSKTNIKFENLLFKRQSTVHEVLSMFYRCFMHALYLLYINICTIIVNMLNIGIFKLVAININIYIIIFTLFN